MFYVRYLVFMYIYVMQLKIRMTTFTKVNLKKTDEQTNIDKYRVATHRILQNIISEQNFDLFHH